MVLLENHSLPNVPSPNKKILGLLGHNKYYIQTKGDSQVYLKPRHPLLKIHGWLFFNHVKTSIVVGLPGVVAGVGWCQQLKNSWSTPTVKEFIKLKKQAFGSWWAMGIRKTVHM